MLIDADALADDQTLRSDICIIGGGPAGITMLRELAQTDLKVTLLEAGGEHFSKRDQLLASGENIGRPYVPLRRSRSASFGGSSNLWHIDPGMRCHPLEEIDFEVRPWIAHSGWPFDRAYLQPYYERAHDLLELGRFEYDPPASAESDLLPGSQDQLSTTLFRFAKTDVLRNKLPHFEQAAHITLVFNATVLELEVDGSGSRIDRVRVATRSGRKVFAEADVFVLAAGGIENARLLLLSNSRYEQGIGNQNDLVGRFFMEHPHLNSGYIASDEQEPFSLPEIYLEHEELGVKAVGALVLAPEVQEVQRTGSFSAFVHNTSAASRSQGARSLRSLYESLVEGYRSRSALGHLANVVRDPGGAIRFGLDRLLKRSAYLAELTVMAEQLPNPESRVTLSSKRDRFGQRGVRLDWQLLRQDFQTIQVGQEVIDRQLQERGFGRLAAKYAETSPRQIISGGMHHIGTTRMADDPKRGVVDADCKVHDVPNLFIAGSSVFPTGGYANPTLTIIALSIRLSDHLKRTSARI